MGIACLLMFALYLRPPELLGLHGFQLIPPVPHLGNGYRFWSVLVRPDELGVPGKTGEFDETVCLDVPELHWLDPHLRYLKTLAPEQGPLWRFDYNALLKAFHSAAAEAGVGHLSPTLYSMRHGGASHDRMINRRPLDEVRKRGRWQTARSVRRYEKHGRLSLHVQLLGQGTLTSLLEDEWQLERRFAKFFGRLSAVPAQWERGHESLSSFSQGQAASVSPSGSSDTPASSGTFVTVRCLTSRGPP